jgi:hypothetical protein
MRISKHQCPLKALKRIKQGWLAFGFSLLFLVLNYKNEWHTYSLRNLV